MKRSKNVALHMQVEEKNNSKKHETKIQKRKRQKNKYEIKTSFR